MGVRAKRNISLVLIQGALGRTDGSKIEEKHFARIDTKCAKAQRLEYNMINFEDELAKFHPSLEVEGAEDTIYNQDLTDMADILVKMLKESVEELEEE